MKGLYQNANGVNIVLSNFSSILYNKFAIRFRTNSLWKFNELQLERSFFLYIRYKRVLLYLYSVVLADIILWLYYVYTILLSTWYWPKIANLLCYQVMMWFVWGLHATWENFLSIFFSELIRLQSFQISHCKLMNIFWKM